MPPRIVQNFGLFWERGEVEWGTRGRGRRGHLRGYTTDPGAAVDFREQRGLYVLYEGESIATHRVVYIGQAGSKERDLFHRLRDHRDDALWNRWQRFSWFGFLAVGVGRQLVHVNKAAVGNVGFPTALDQMEAVLIALFEPVKNQQGPRWKGATEYFQVRNSSAGAA
jgi:uncharacterized protein (UPF0248 family)